MLPRGRHYESAYESQLRARRIPYISVDEARKTLVPPESAPSGAAALKSFDFVVYPPSSARGEGNLLVDVKGRRGEFSVRASRGFRGEMWVTQEDISSMTQWQRLFGPGFQAVFAFLYWCDQQPPDGLFDEIFEFHARWYALRMVSLAEFTRHMRPRSPRWGTVSLRAADLHRPPRVGPRGRPEAWSRGPRPFHPTLPAVSS